jgi:WD40 repeat protein
MMTYDVGFFDTHTLTQLGSLDFVDYPCAISFSPDGRQIAVAQGISGTVVVANLTGPQPVTVADFPAHTASIDLDTAGEAWTIGDIAWSPTGALLATSGMSPSTFDSTGAPTGSDDYTIKLWEIGAMSHDSTK